MFLWSTLFCLWVGVVALCTGLDLSPCVGGKLDAAEFSKVSLTCEQTSSTLWWKMYRGSQEVSTVATCDATQCVSQGNATDVRATRPSGETSVLYVDLKTHRNRSVKVQCFSRHRVTCSVRSVYYSEPRNCKLDVNAEAMRVQGSCVVPKIYASDDNYVCQWLRQSKNGTATLNGTFSLTTFVDNTTTATTATATTGQLSYKKGVCSFSASLFLVEGVFNFSVRTSPGSGASFVATVTVDDHSNVTVTGAESVNVTVSQGKGDLKMAQCTNNKLIDAEEGEVVGLTCQSTSRQVKWTVTSNTNHRRIDVAVCNATHCTMQRGGYDAATHSSRMLAIRPNNSFTELYVDVGAYRRSLTTFACYKYYHYYTCRVRAVYSAWPTNCQFDFDQENSTLRGSCYIPKIYSAGNFYQCQWIEQYKEQTERIITGSFYPTSFTENGRTYKKGTCSFTAPLFEIDGTFTYRIDITPGHQEYIASIDVAVKGETSSLTISGRGHLDTRITHNVTEIQYFKCSGGTYEVPLGARVGLTCSRTRSTMRWNVYYSGRHNREVASCNSTQCTMKQGSGFYSSSLLATRPNDTSSVLYVDMASFQGRTTRFYCYSRYSSSCYLRTVYTSRATNCELSVDVSNTTVTGSCQFEKMFTSDSSYTCRFVIQDDNQVKMTTSGRLSITSFYDKSLGQRLYSGNCSFSASFFLTPGTLNFSIEAKPGSTTHLAFLHVDEDSNATVSAADDVNATVFGTASELQTLNCANGATYDVSPDAQLALMCKMNSYYIVSNYNFMWQTHSYTYTYSWNYKTVATCSMTSCSNQVWSQGWFMATRLNSTVSVAHINMQKYSSRIMNVKCSLRYERQTCKLRLVYSATPSNCHFEVDAINKTVSAQCDIAKIQASDDSYGCSWIQSFENQTESKVRGYFDRRTLSSINGRRAYNGTCSFTFPLFPIANSNISYTVHFHPGQRFLVATVLMDESLNITVEGSEGVNTTLTPGEVEAPIVVHCSEKPTLVDVPENGIVAMVCPETLQSFKWQYKYNSYYYYYNLMATCNATACTPKLNSKDYLTTRPNASLSVLYYQMKNSRYQRMNFECTSQHGRRSIARYCYLRPVYPASLVNCSLEVDADHMMVTGSCEIEKVYSSDQSINCTWIERFKHQTVRYINGTLGLHRFVDPGSWREYRNGSCSFTAPLLLVSGVFQYSVHVQPGQPTHIATLYLDGPSNMTLVGADDVETSLSGAPTEMNLFECRNGQTVDIPEYTQAGLVCRETQGEEGDQPSASHIKWLVYPDAHKGSAASHGGWAGSGSGSAPSNASCNVSSCQVYASGEDMLAVRPNASTSILYLSLLEKRDYHQRVECRTSSSSSSSSSSHKFCIIRSVYSAQLTNCQFDFNTTTYTVQGSCEVKKMYSSDGQYTCEWIQQVQHQTKTFPATSFPLRSYRDPLNRLSYRRGTCRLSLQLLMVTKGAYVFSIRVSPGTTMYVATLELGTANHDRVKLTGGDHVNATINGMPQEEPTTSTSTSSSTVSSTPERTSQEMGASSTHQPPHPSPTSSPTLAPAHAPATADEHKKVVTYVAVGVGGTIGIILIVVIVVIGILVLRKLQGPTEPDTDGGIDNEGYFYTSRLKSGSIADISSNVSLPTSIDSGHSSSCL